MYELNSKREAGEMGPEELMNTGITVFFLLLIIAGPVAVIWKAVSLVFNITILLENSARCAIGRICGYVRLVQLILQQDIFGDDEWNFEEDAEEEG